MSEVLLAQGVPDFFSSFRKTWEIGVGIGPSMHEFKMKSYLEVLNVINDPILYSKMILSSHPQRGSGVGCSGQCYIYIYARSV